MVKTPTLCIAGKNNIAAKALVFAAAKLGISNVVFLPSESDGGNPAWQTSARAVAQQLGVRIIENTKNLYSIRQLIFISLEFDKLIDPSLFLSKKLFNIHFSILPKYRGVYTSFLPILHGQKESGVTLHYIDSGIDTGPIIDQITFLLPLGMSAYELYDFYSLYAYEIFCRNFNKLVFENQIESAIQKESESTYYSRKMVSFDEIEINCNLPSQEILNWVHAMMFPAFQVPTFRGKRINFISTCAKNSLEIGQVREVSETSFFVGTQDLDILLVIDQK